MLLYAHTTKDTVGAGLKRPPAKGVKRDDVGIVPYTRAIGVIVGVGLKRPPANGTTDEVKKNV